MQALETPDRLIAVDDAFLRCGEVHREPLAPVYVHVDDQDIIERVSGQRPLQNLALGVHSVTSFSSDLMLSPAIFRLASSSMPE